MTLLLMMLRTLGKDQRLSLGNSMKLHEILPEKFLIAPNQSDVKATEMSLPNYMDKRWRDIGRRTNIRRERISIRDPNTRVVYGFRTIFQKST